MPTGKPDVADGWNLKREISKFFFGDFVKYNFLIQLGEFNFEQFNTILRMKACKVNPIVEFNEFKWLQVWRP